MNILMLSSLANKPSRFFRNVARMHQPQCTNMSTNVQWQFNKNKFQDLLPSVIDSVCTIPKIEDSLNVTTWLRRALEYNLAGGKKTRGLTTVLAYEMLEKPENITEESMRLARILGWSVEMLLAFFQISDDIMDKLWTHRNIPSWYRLPDVGLGAVNDISLIHCCFFRLLQTYCSHMPQYTNIMDLCNDTVLLSSIGQRFDYTMAHRNKNDYSLFTIDRYETIVKYKTALIAYKLPVCLGLYLANIIDEEIHSKAENISLDIGIFFQIQNDFIDCYSDKSVSGKTGTDIQEGKCSWLAVTALQLCNPTQRKVFEECYGSKDPTKVERIKQLYDELDLPRIYRERKRAQYDDIIYKAQALNRETNISPKLFIKLVDIINREN